jgi:hypothetical protein
MRRGRAKNGERSKRRLNCFAATLDTLISIHGHTEASLLSVIGVPPDHKTMQALRNWRSGETRPRVRKYIAILEAIEAHFHLPSGRLAYLAGGRGSEFYRAIEAATKGDFASQQLFRWHIPADFDIRPEQERKEIMSGCRKIYCPVPRTMENIREIIQKRNSQLCFQHCRVPLGAANGWDTF